MKFSVAFACALVGLVAADSSQTAQQISDAAKKIAAAIDNFDQKVKGFSGDVAGLTAASEGISKATSDAQSSLGSAAPLTLTDALGIQPLFQSLQTTIDGAMADLTSQKQKLVDAKAGCDVQKQLDSQEKNAQSLATLITGKVPTEVKTVAETLAGNVGASITKAKQTFSDACSAGGSSGGSSSGGSTPPPAGGHSGHGGSTPASGSSGSSSGSKTSGGSTTSAPAGKPAVYTGAGTQNTPALAAAALAIAAFAL